MIIASNLTETEDHSRKANEAEAEKKSNWTLYYPKRAGIASNRAQACGSPENGKDNPKTPEEKRTRIQANVAETMERASRGVRKARSLADKIGEASFIAVLDRLRIESMTTIPRLEMLKTLVAELEREAARTAA